MFSTVNKLSIIPLQKTTKSVNPVMINKQSFTLSNCQKSTMPATLAYQKDEADFAFKGIAPSNNSSILIKTLKFFSRIGSRETDVLNMLGKAVLAFAATTYNPFVKNETKEDKQARKYSAWMLPVEAILLFSSTLVLSLALNKGIDFLGKKGHLKVLGKSFNKELVNNETLNNNLNALKDLSYYAAAIVSVPATWLTPAILKKFKSKKEAK